MTTLLSRELLRDAFNRLIEHVDEVADGLTDEQANYRPTASANTIAWLIWHSARVQDIQLAPIARVDQVWTHDGWVDRSGSTCRATTLVTATEPGEVAKVHAPVELLAGYYHAVHKLTLELVPGSPPRRPVLGRRPQLGSAGDGQRRWSA